MTKRTGVVDTSGSARTLLSAPLLDIDDVAESLGVTPRHIQRLVAERRIPFVKVGRFVRFDPAALDVWLDQQRVEPVGSSPRDHGTPWR
jgi:excisionase family DNA binding protein